MGSPEDEAPAPGHKGVPTQRLTLMAAWGCLSLPAQSGAGNLWNECVFPSGLGSCDWSSVHWHSGARCLHSLVFSQSRVSVPPGDTWLSPCFSPSFPIPKCGKTLVRVQFCLFYLMANTNVSSELLLFLSPAVFPVHNLSIFNLLHSDLFS